MKWGAVRGSRLGDRRNVARSVQQSIDEEKRPAGSIKASYVAISGSKTACNFLFHAEH